jgi:hypothetical protein
MIPRVIVIVKGGVAEVLRKDKGVEFVLVDYDIEGAEEHIHTNFRGEKASVDTLSSDEEVKDTHRIIFEEGGE